MDVPLMANPVTPPEEIERKIREQNERKATPISNKFRRTCPDDMTLMMRAWSGEVLDALETCERAELVALSRAEQAEKWIRVVGEETESGGDRNTTLAAIRALVKLRTCVERILHPDNASVTSAAILRAELGATIINAVLQPNHMIGGGRP